MDVLAAMQARVYSLHMSPSAWTTRSMYAQAVAVPCLFTHAHMGQSCGSSHPASSSFPGGAGVEAPALLAQHVASIIGCVYPYNDTGDSEDKAVVAHTFESGPLPQHLGEPAKLQG